MVRTVWLATACLAVLGALGIGTALTAPVASATAERPFDETTIGAGFGQDTLTKADRLKTGPFSEFLKSLNLSPACAS
jgi:hypothetical protein